MITEDTLRTWSELAHGLRTKWAPMSGEHAREQVQTMEAMTALIAEVRRLREALRGTP